MTDPTEGYQIPKMLQALVPRFERRRVLKSKILSHPQGVHFALLPLLLFRALRQKDRYPEGDDCGHGLGNSRPGLYPCSVHLLPSRREHRVNCHA